MKTSIDEDRVYRLLGSRLRRLREQKGLSQADLADHVGMLRTSITNIEAGRQRPPLHVLYQICFALERDLSHLLPSNEETMGKTDLFIESVAAADGSSLTDYRIAERPEAASVLQSLVAQAGKPPLTPKQQQSASDEHAKKENQNRGTTE